MSCNKHITNSIACRVGSMKCSKCEKNIKGVYLVKNIYDDKSRGNENDTCQIYCYNCSSGDRTWIKYWESEIKRKDEIISDYQDKVKKFCDSLRYDTD